MKHFADAGRHASGAPAARHGFVDSTLTVGERIAPFLPGGSHSAVPATGSPPWATLAEPDFEPLPAHTRVQRLDETGVVLVFEKGRLQAEERSSAPSGRLSAGESEGAKQQ